MQVITYALETPHKSKSVILQELVEFSVEPYRVYQMSRLFAHFRTDGHLHDFFKALLFARLYYVNGRHP